MFIVTIDIFDIISATSKDATKNLIYDKESTPDILRGEVRYQTAREDH